MTRDNSAAIYEVWSTHEDGTQVRETRRTSQGVAINDQSIIKSILYRNSWIVEVA